MNDSGQVVFQAVLTNTIYGTEEASAILSWAGGAVFEVARRGRPIPGHGVLIRPTLGGINNAGQIAFSSPLTETIGGADTDWGIFLFDNSHGIIEVARKGDALLGSTISELALRNGADLNSEYSPINAAGITRVAYHFTLADGRQGIAVWSLIPEPGSCLLVGIGLLVIGGMRPRDWRKMGRGFRR
jgi:hypothetical protein